MGNNETEVVDASKYLYSQITISLILAILMTMTIYILSKVFNYSLSLEQAVIVVGILTNLKLFWYYDNSYSTITKIVLFTLMHYILYLVCGFIP